MSAYQAGKPLVSSTVTKHNPRPRKYASASERQAAYRARAPEVCFRAEAKTVETLDAIAETLDQPRADLLLSMTKFALANHDWARFGMTHKPLPYGYGLAEERAANPQPIWKRTRPKSLGKPVPLTPKQKAAAKARAAAAGRPYPNLVDNIAASRLENPTVPIIYSVKSQDLIADAEAIEQSAKESQKAWVLLGQFDKYSQAMDTAYRLRKAAEEKNLTLRREILRNAGFTVRTPKQAAKDIEGKLRKENPMKKPTPAQLAARAKFAEMARSGAFKRKTKATRRKANPLGVAGGRYEILWGGSGDLKASYDDLGQAKDFLDDIDRPPGLFYGRDTKTGKHFFSFAAVTKFPNINIRGTAMQKAYKANPRKKTVSEKISQLVHEGYPQKQAVAVALSEERAGKVKRNPTTGTYGPFYGDPDAPLTEAQIERMAETYMDRLDRQLMRGDITQPQYDREVAALNKWVKEKYSKRKRNPATGTKKSRTKLNPMKATYKFALVEDDGGFGFGMDARTPVKFTFSNRDRTKGVYRSFAVPDAAVKNPAFQQWASSLPGNSTILSLDQLRAIIKGYMS